MSVYFSKAENATSEAIKEVGKDEFNYEKMKALAKTHTTKRKCSGQEAVCLLMPKPGFRKTFPKVNFLNSNLPQCRYRICRQKEELDVLPDGSTDIFGRNMLDRYTGRLDSHFQNGKYAILENISFAEIFCYYYVESKINEKSNSSDNYPVVLNDEVVLKPR